MKNYFEIVANGVTKVVYGGDNPLNKLAHARIEMAMAEEGDESVKAYLEDYAELLDEYAKEDGRQPHKDVHAWLDYIADDLVSTNTHWFTYSQGRMRQIKNRQDTDAIYKEIMSIFQKELSTVNC